MSSGTNTAYYASGSTLASGEIPGDGVSYRLSQVRPQDITDGLSNTIFASEKYMDKCPQYNYYNGTAAADNNSAMDGFGSARESLGALSRERHLLCQSPPR